MTTATTEAVTELHLDELAAALRGEIITPDHPGYDQARAVYNGMIDRRPAVIVRCRDADALAEAKAAVEAMIARLSGDRHPL